MNLFVKGTMLTAVVAVFGGTSAAAQNTDTDDIDVTAVVETAIQVTGTQDLIFGAVFPGFGRTIAIADAASAEFVITGGVGGGVDIDLTLPTELSDGANVMPVSFTAAAGAARGTAIGFNPAVTHPNSLDGTTGELRVYLGGTVTAAPTQVAGSYSAVATLTASYNGL